MTKTELRDLVKSHFSLVDATEHTFAQAELIDGTVVKTDGEGGFEVGQKAMVVTEDGTEVQAPTGEHELKDGTVIVINEAGEITGVKTKDEAGEGSLSEEPAAEVAMAEHEIAEEVIETVMEEGMSPGDVLEAVKVIIEEVVQPQIEELKKEMMSYKEKMEKVSAEPATESALTSKFNKVTVDNSAKTLAEKRAEAALFSLQNKSKN
tara:strand:- start:1256 stop:1876 length:621 start_codon:yes stop_codon:yes gene_type:complete